MTSLINIYSICISNFFAFYIANLTYQADYQIFLNIKACLNEYQVVTSTTLLVIIYYFRQIPLYMYRD